MAVIQTYWQALVVSVTLFSFQGTVYAQLLAILRDSMRARGEIAQGTVGSAIRMSLSIGYAAGPLLGTIASALAGYRWTFALAAALWLVVLWVTVRLSLPTTSKNSRPTAKSRGLPTAAVVTFALAGMIALSGDTIKVAYIPILVVNRLHQTPIAIGLLFGLGTAAEIITMPLAGRLADRFGFQRVIVSALLIGVADYALLAESSSLWQLYLVQLAHAGMLGALHGIGSLYVQTLSHGSIGAATSLLVSAQTLASPFGALVGSYGAGIVGVPAVFFVSSVLCGVAAIMTAATGWGDGRPRVAGSRLHA